jgi:hypothetical protein
MELVAVWNAVLTVLLAIVGFFMASKFRELDRLSILLNRTREEVARDHITRAEFRQDMKELLERFDRIESKIDNLRSKPHAV